VTEIPEHLLERTRSRRQALGLPVAGGGDGGEGGAAAAPVPAAAGGGGGPVAAAPKGPVAPSGGGGPVARPAPRPPAPYVEAARRRVRIPVWAVPVVALLPLWGLLYAGTLQPPPVRTLSLVQEGAVVYSGAAGCAGCHGGTGGGGVGPRLAGGDVVTTFPNPVDHVRWVVLGSADGAEVYEAAGKTPKGGMPSFQATLTLQQIVEVVLHERQTLSDKDIAEEAEQWAQLRELPEEFPDAGYTEEEINTILEEIAEQNGVEIPE
jgi:mono/diheme cytochrome c family protein